MTQAEPRGEIARTHESYIETNEQILAEIETRGAADPLLDEKLARIDAALQAQQERLDRLALDRQRPRLAGGAGGESVERKSAWGAYLRSGIVSPIETKALNSAVDAEGGYLAPDELDRRIESRLEQSSPMRRIASVRQTSAGLFRKPISVTGPQAGWVAETADRPQTAQPVLSEVQFPAAELYANIAATPQLLDDAFANVEEWIASEVEGAFAQQESTAFVSGDGNGRPRGFLNYTLVADATHSWGNIGYIASGAAGAFAAANPADRLLDLVYAPKARYRARGRFVMNRKTLSAVRKLKDADGDYLFSPTGPNGTGPSLLGYPITEIEEMPDIGANAAAIAFGDFERGYLIVDRQGTRVLRDPYSAKPFVLFYVTKRVGGGVQDFDAIKVLRFSAS